MQHYPRYFVLKARELRAKDWRGFSVDQATGCEDLDGKGVCGESDRWDICGRCMFLSCHRLLFGFLLNGQRCVIVSCVMAEFVVSCCDVDMLVDCQS